jgi:hypothetical protein
MDALRFCGKEASHFTKGTLLVRERSPFFHNKTYFGPINHFTLLSLIYSIVKYYGNGIEFYFL